MTIQFEMCSSNVLTPHTHFSMCDSWTTGTFSAQNPVFECRTRKRSLLCVCFRIHTCVCLHILLKKIWILEIFLIGLSLILITSACVPTAPVVQPKCARLFFFFFFFCLDIYYSFEKKSSILMFFMVPRCRCFQSVSLIPVV